MVQYNYIVAIAKEGGYLFTHVHILGVDEMNLAEFAFTIEITKKILEIVMAEHPEIIVRATKEVMKCIDVKGS